MEYDYYEYDDLIQKLLKEVPQGMLPSDYLEEKLGPCELDEVLEACLQEELRRNK